MTAYTPTPLGRDLLKALALPTRNRPPDRDGWWSANDLRTDPRTHAAFRNHTAAQVAGTAGQLVRQGLARSRRIGTRGHGWAEYRITGTGRAWTEDPPQDDEPVISAGLVIKDEPEIAREQDQETRQ